jgi:hypothetical protein
MIKLETVNIILALIVIIILVIMIYQGKDGENFKYSTKCNKVTKKYCNMMKNDQVDVFGDPIVLSEMMDACGKDAYPRLAKCYPKWATIRGGTSMANIDLILNQINNPMYK